MNDKTDIRITKWIFIIGFVLYAIAAIIIDIHLN